MQTTIQKWGNSLAVRIPGAYVKEAGLSDGLPVSMVMEDGILMIMPAKKKYLLNDLLGKIDAENLHGEIQSGEPIGNELW
jgi:antitoxin MazE